METLVLGVTCLLVAVLLSITFYVAGKLKEIKELKGHFDEVRKMILDSIKEYSDLIDTAKEIATAMEKETDSYKTLLDETDSILEKMDNKLSTPEQPKKQRGRPRKNNPTINS